MNPLSNPLKQSLTEFEAVIFDLDGTLLDSMWIWSEIDKEYLERFDIIFPYEMQNELDGKSFSEVAIFFKERFNLPDSLETIKADWNAMACDKYRYEVPFKKGALPFLQFCKEIELKIGIATSNSRELVEHAAQALSLHDYVSCILTSCEVNKGKPAPDIYLAVAERLCVNPAKCLVFEDIIPGIMAGRNAGMEVCAVEDYYSADFRKEKQELADYFIDDFYELL